MIQQRLENYIIQNRCTMLGVGPMSLNCVNATIDLANEHDVPLILIASRRQVDTDYFGGGYVNNWTTDAFACHVIDNDKKGNVFLARDHGGPWQNNKEIEENLSLRRAMESAKLSYKADIDAGFQILHIDPSIDIHGKPTIDEILERIYELYEFCWSYAIRLGKEVIFEIGTEEQNGTINNMDELEYTIIKVQKFCTKNNLPNPTFVVVQTGTRVMETRNVGSLDSPVRVADEMPAEIQLPRMIELCRKYKIFIKEHNTDYLSDEALQWHPRLGIHSANVAPEFGVLETQALLEVLEQNLLQSLSDRFLEIAYDSGKWKKWMLPETSATNRDRAIIAGHYVFATENCKKIKEEAAHELQRKNIDLEDWLRKRVKLGILRYLINFRLVRSI